MAFTKTGSSATSALRHQVGSSIQTDEFGVDVGKVEFIFNSADTALSNRPRQGDLYSGPCREFTGFMADTAGAVRMVGGDAQIPVLYAKKNPDFIVKPMLSSEISYLDINQYLATLGLTTLPGIPVPNPTITYRFCDVKPQGKLSTYSTNLPDMPAVPVYVYYPSQLLRIHPGINFTSVPFIPDPQGWLCLQDSAEPFCGGQLYRITQSWKRFRLYGGPIFV